MADAAQKQEVVDKGIMHSIAQMKGEILAHGPRALVSMGFFAPEVIAPGWSLRTPGLLTESELNFLDFHAYPGRRRLNEYPVHLGMLGCEARPVVLGEYGASHHQYMVIASVARAVTGWVAHSCRFGLDGWLYWTQWPANPDVATEPEA